MKVGEVPQDPGSSLAGHEKLNYAVGEDGAYTGVATIGWEAEISATAVSTAATRMAIQKAWEQAKRGETSPLGYHMAVVQMDAGQLAGELGKWAWQVRRHLKPGVWAGLSAAQLAQYAEVMSIPVASLLIVPDAPDLP